MDAQKVSTQVCPVKIGVLMKSEAKSYCTQCVVPSFVTVYRKTQDGTHDELETISVLTLSDEELEKMKFNRKKRWIALEALWHNHGHKESEHPDLLYGRS